MQRVMVFVDGFNLYYGLRSEHGRKYHWLDLEKLATNLLKKDRQTLVCVKYFTARVRNDPAAQLRQSEYLDALATHCTKLDVINGRFQEKPQICKGCGKRWVSYEEKETDVSIAIALVEHGVRDDFDVAMIISGDSDLCPAVRSLRRLYPEKHVIVAFPPARWSTDLKNAALAAFPIGQAKIRQSQLPTEVRTEKGRSFKRPGYWT